MSTKKHSKKNNRKIVIGAVLGGLVTIVIAIIAVLAIQSINYPKLSEGTYCSEAGEASWLGKTTHSYYCVTVKNSSEYTELTMEYLPGTWQVLADNARGTKTNFVIKHGKGFTITDNDGVEATISTPSEKELVIEYKDSNRDTQILYRNVAEEMRAERDADS